MQIDLSIPALGNKFIDSRATLPGDGFNWNWIRDLSQVNYLAIHHTADLNVETAEDLANYHIQNNGWGGIGYHFVIDKQGVVFYVGDISTARANVANLNEQVIGICIMGNFVQGLHPTNEQLNSAHKLCEALINYPPLSNLTSWDKVRGHKELPDQSSTCPGDDWSNWRIQIVEGINLKVENSKPEVDVQNFSSQVDSLQASLASVNQQVISLQESLQERDEEITNLKRVAHLDQTLTLPQALINLYKLLLPPRKES